MGVPWSRAIVLGCISLAHNQPGYFTEAHLTLAATFADQAVIAVQNARLFEAESSVGACRQRCSSGRPSI